MKTSQHSTIPDVYFLDLDIAEESCLAKSVYDMLSKSRRLTEDKYKFLFKKMWIGRGNFGNSLNPTLINEWDACVDWFHDQAWRNGEPLLDLKVINDGYASFQKNGTGRSILGSAEHVKGSIIKIWYAQWENHPIRKSAEIFDTWPYPEVVHGARILAEQPMRIEKAIQVEAAFWERARQEWETGNFTEVPNCLEYVADFMHTARRVLHEMDRDAWLARGEEIKARTGCNNYYVEARVKGFNPKPDYLYLMDQQKYFKARQVYLANVEDPNVYERLDQDIYRPKRERPLPGYEEGEEEVDCKWV